MLAFGQRFMGMLFLTGALTFGSLIFCHAVKAEEPKVEVETPKLTPAQLEEVREINQLLPPELQIRMFAAEANGKKVETSDSNQKKQISPTPPNLPSLFLETRKLSYRQEEPLRPIFGDSDQRQSLAQTVESIRRSARNLELIAANLEIEELYDSADVFREQAKTLWTTARELTLEHKKTPEL
jgi:hypothetical protein